MNEIKDKALDFIHRNDSNFYALNINFELSLFGNSFHPESIWYSKDEDKIYLHGGCDEFEGDLDIESLSNNNQNILIDILNSHLPDESGKC